MVFELPLKVGAVNIDSTWATQFNNFEVDTNKFPDFSSLVKSLHDKNVKVTMWATSMVNVENPDFEYAVEKGANQSLIKYNCAHLFQFNETKHSLKYLSRLFIVKLERRSKAYSLVAWRRRTTR